MYLLYTLYLNHSLLESEPSYFFALGIFTFYSVSLDDDPLFCLVSDFFLGLDFFLEQSDYTDLLFSSLLRLLDGDFIDFFPGVTLIGLTKEPEEDDFADKTSGIGIDRTGAFTFSALY